MLYFRLWLILLMGMVMSYGQNETTPPHWKFAPKPPMGWNSWDCFGTSITEAQAKQQADIMAEKLQSHGWEYFVVDIQWYEPESKGHTYRKDATLEMDEFGRLLPALKKFPSAANGAGFKALADYVHSKGLKFGVHIMRGIPKQAVAQNTLVKGTSVHAADIANTKSTCSWNGDMYGVDVTKPGGQEYYDSVYELLASWKIDFVKVDDISRPYDSVQKGEIEAIRKAIDKTGRPIVLSLSPGDTPLNRGDHVRSQANMWRISDDFWDKWKPLEEMFGRLEKWTQYRTEGAWPDADMLPLGMIEFKRKTKFTPDEQTLLMTLWSIARSPLILGADLAQLDEATLSLITNDEVLAVNQNSANNHQLFRNNNLIAWVADVPGASGKYLAVFNAQDTSADPAGTPVEVKLSDLGFSKAHVRDLWSKKDLGEFNGSFAPVIPCHGAGLYRME